MRKASHLGKIKMLRDINEKVISKELKQIGLFSFRANRDLNRYAKQLSSYLLRQKGKQFMNALLENHDGFKKQRRVSKFLIRKHKLHKMICFR